MTLNNPYLNRNAIREASLFFGRETEIAAVMTRLQSTQPQSVEIVGERRIGKSSLLNAIKRKLLGAEQLSFVGVFIDGQTFTAADPARFYTEVRGQVKNALGGLPGNFEATFDGIEDLVRCLDREKHTLVIFCDEFDVITANRNFQVEFFDFLRALANNFAVAYILATSKELEKECHNDKVKGSPFFNIFYKLQLGSFSEEEARLLISAPSTEAGCPLGKYEDIVLSMGGRFPFFTQMGCSSMIQFYQRHSIGSLPEIKSIQRVFYGEAQPHFDHIWDRLSSGSKNVLSKIADQRILGKEEINIASALEIRGYLYSRGESYSLFSQTFAAFVNGKASTRREWVDAGSLKKEAVVCLRLTHPGGDTQDDATLRWIKRCVGRELVSFGNGTEGHILRFVTPTEALSACTSLLRSFRERSATGASSLCLGMDFGELFEYDNVLRGSAITLAQRLCSLADDGEIVCSQNVLQRLEKQLARQLRKLAPDRYSSEVQASKLFVWNIATVVARQREQFAKKPSSLHSVPPPGVNNVWYEYRESETAVVFVHGVLSDSRGCWLRAANHDVTNDTYWPELVRQDGRLERPSIFLGGYYTDIASGPYDIDNCERELYQALRTPAEPGLRTAMAWENLIFVCHSTGGIVVRNLLERRQSEFKDKRIGLLLIASPSFGSRLADKLDWLIKFYKHELGKQLEWGNWSLRDLDGRFKDLVNDRKIRNLRGVEACENRFIIHRRWLPNITYVVDEESAGRYFGAPIMLANTDHFSAVKPESFAHPAHRLLLDFYLNEFAAPPCRRLDQAS